MAAYEKPQPQPQPSPPPAHLNAAYYGPAIPPPQPAYYGPPPSAPAHPRRRGAACFFCLLLKIIAAVVIALGAAILVLWLIYRPDLLRATADSAALSRFDLSPDGRNLQYNLTVNIRVRNPNRFGISYDFAEAQAYYDGDERFGYAPLRPFYLESKSDETITAAFNGAAVMTDDDVEKTYRRENREGFYRVKVSVYSDLTYRVRIVRRSRSRRKITCELRLPVPAAGSTVTMTPLGTRCDVDF